MNIKPEILALLQIDDMPVVEFNDDQKKIIRNNFPNIRCNGVGYSEGYGIIFTNKETHNNWLYYAGFEYIKEGVDIIDLDSQNTFVALFSYQEDRVENILDRLGLM